MAKGPRLLLLDIETSPILAYVWSLWDQNVGLNQIYKDWFVLSWSAKWLDQPEVMYMDQRYSVDLSDDKRILKQLWDLLDEADVIVTQNGKSFDAKKLNARFIQHGFPPPAPYKHIDTKLMAKKNFAFTSNKLEYLGSVLSKSHKKHTHRKFSGFELWSECLKGNQAAWDEMEVYNTLDVLVLEEVYRALAPWGVPVNLSSFPQGVEACSCGSTKYEKRGFHYTATAKYQRLRCVSCGSWTRDKINLRSKPAKHRPIT
jgi:hypothetical protein